MAVPLPVTPDSPPRFNREPRAWLRDASAGNRLAYIIRALPASIIRTIPRLGLKAGDRVLDYGCADRPYRENLPVGVTYVGADIAGNRYADVELTPDGALPLEDDGFDAVLSTQVLEHVVEPARYLAECYRQLRPGGRLLLSTHGTMILHPDPIDYWRWTSDGLRHQVETAGFQIIDFEGVMGLSATGIQLFQDATLGNLPRRLRGPYAFIMQTLVAICDRLHSDRSRAYNALVYLLVAEKPVLRASL